MAVDNLKIQQQINAAIQARQALLRAETAELQKQLSLANSINEAMGDISLGGQADDVEELSDALGEAAEAASKMGEESNDALADLARSVDDGTEGIASLGDGVARLASRFPVLGTTAVAAIDGMVSGFRFSMNMLSSLSSMVSSLIGGLFSVGKAILSIPFRIMGGLIDMAKSGGGGNELAQAFENVRKEFGDFRQAVAKDVIGMSRSMRGALAETGLSAFRIFGNMANALQHFTELAKEMGSTFHNVVGDMTKVELQRFASFQKGLGLSGEDMRTFAREAIGSGESVNEKLREIANFSLQMADQFGLSQKLLARDMAKMRGDVDKFGNLTVKKMAQAATYVRKLGLEIEDLGGIFDKYDNFETAAEGVADFARVFGVNLDVFSLVQAESGADRLEMMRKSFFAAGKDASNLSRIELKRLAEASGLADANVAKLAFSAQNAGMSMEEIEKGSEKAEKQQITQAEAMEKLAASIERLVQSGSGFGPGGFFAHFFQGLQIGMKRSPEFMKLMMGIRRSLMTVMRIGMQLGRVLPKLFAPLGEIFSAFNELLGAGNIGPFFENFSNALGNFLKDIQGADPEAAVRNLFDSLANAFQEFAGSSSGPMKRLADAFFSVGKIVIKAIGGLTPVLMRELGGLFTKLGKFIADPSSIENALNAAGNAAEGPKQAFIKSLITAAKGIADAWPVLWDGMRKLFGAVFEKVRPWLERNGPKIIGGSLAFIFGPAVLGALIKSALAGLGGLLTRSIGKIFTTSADDIAKKAGPKMASKLGSIFKVAGPIGAALAVGVGVKDGLKKFKGNTLNAINEEFGGDNEVAAKMGAASAGIIDSFTFGLLPDDITQQLSTAVGKLSAKFFEVVESEMGSFFTRNLKDTFSDIIDIGDAIGGIFEGLIEGDTDKMIASLKEGIKSAVSGAFNLALVAGELIAEFGPGILKSLLSLFEFVFFGIPKALGQLLYEYVLVPIGKFFSEMGSDVLAGLSETAAGISDSFSDAWNDVKGVWKKAVNYFKGLGRKIMRVIDRLGKDISDVFADAWESAKREWDNAIDFFKALPGKIATALGNLANTVKKPFVDAFKAATSIWEGIGGWFSENVIDPIIDTFTSLKADVLSAFEGIWTGITSSISTAAGVLKKILKDAFKQILEPIITVLKKVEPVVSGVNATMGSMLKTLIDTYEIRSPSKAMQRAGKAIIDGLDMGMSHAGAVAKKPVTAMVNTSRDLMTESENLRRRLDDDRARVVDLKTKVGSLRNGSILGSDGTIKVKRPDHTLTINLKAVFDAGQVERVMIDRPGSQIATVNQPFG